MQDQSEALELLLTEACGRPDKPTVVAVGATVQPGLAETAAAMGWMTDPEIITIGSVRLSRESSRLCREYGTVKNVTYL